MLIELETACQALEYFLLRTPTMLGLLLQSICEPTEIKALLEYKFAPKSDNIRHHQKSLALDENKRRCYDFLNKVGRAEDFLSNISVDRWSADIAKLCCRHSRAWWSTSRRGTWLEKSEISNLLLIIPSIQRCVCSTLYSVDWTLLRMIWHFPWIARLNYYGRSIKSSIKRAGHSTKVSEQGEFAFAASPWHWYMHSRKVDLMKRIDNFWWNSMS